MAFQFPILTVFSGGNSLPLLAVLAILAFIFGMELAGIVIFAEKIRGLKKEYQKWERAVASLSQKTRQTQNTDWFPAAFLFSLSNYPTEHTVLVVLEFAVVFGGLAVAFSACRYRRYLNRIAQMQRELEELSDDRKIAPPVTDSIPQTPDLPIGFSEEDTESDTAEGLLQSEDKKAPTGDLLSVFAPSDVILLPAEAERKEDGEPVEESDDEPSVSYQKAADSDESEAKNGQTQPYRVVETFVRETVKTVVRSNETQEENEPNSDTVTSVDEENEDDFPSDGEDGEPDTEDSKFNSNERVIGYNEETGCYRVAHYRKSFEAKLIQARPNVKEYYGELKNALLSYKGTKSRISWSVDSFHNGRNAIAKINVKTNLVEIFFALDPASLEGTSYRGRDVSGQKKYEETPFAYKLRTPRKLNWALELIARVCEEKGLQPDENAERTDYVSLYPFEDTERLIERGLIKEYVREEKAVTSFELDSVQPLREDDEEEDEEEGDAVPTETETVRVTETHYREQFFGTPQEDVSPAEYSVSETPENTTDGFTVDEETGEVTETAEPENPTNEEPLDRSETDGEGCSTPLPTDPEIATVDLSAVEPYFEDGATVNLRTLAEQGLILESAKELKIYSTAPLHKRFTVEAEHFSFDAIRAVSEAGGEVSLLR